MKIYTDNNVPTGWSNRRIFAITDDLLVYLVDGGIRIEGVDERDGSALIHVRAEDIDELIAAIQLARDPRIVDAVKRSA